MLPTHVFVRGYKGGDLIAKPVSFGWRPIAKTMKLLTPALYMTFPELDVTKVSCITRLQSYAAANVHEK